MAASGVERVRLDRSAALPVWMAFTIRESSPAATVPAELPTFLVEESPKSMAALIWALVKACIKTSMAFETVKLLILRGGYKYIRN